MAYNQNSQAYPGQYPPHYNPSESQNNHGAYMPSGSNRYHESLRRSSSFEAGDDRPVYDERSDPQAGSYRASAHVRMPNQEQYMPSTNPNFRAHVSNSAAGGGFQYHGSSGQAPHVAYNPQQYARTEPQYAASNYTSPIATSTPNMSYQPYNPAAYQATSPQQQSPYTFSGYDHADAGYSSASPYQSHSQNQLPTPQQIQEPFGSTSQSTSPYHGQGPDLPPRPNAYLPASQGSSPNPAFTTTYTPPAPPPPPSMPTPETSYQRSPPSRSSTHNHIPAQHHAPVRTGSGTMGLHHHRLPALPNYQGSGDYSTSSVTGGHSTSPTLTSRLTSSTSSVPLPPQHSTQRTNTTGRHPPSRPLPEPPQTLHDTLDNVNHTNGGPQNFGYDDIMKEVEAAVMGGTPNTASRGHSPRLDRTSYKGRINEEEEPPPLFSSTPRAQTSPRTHTNGVSTSGAGLDVNYDAYSDDSDAEAAAGLAAMQMAEEQEAADMARRSTGAVAAHGRSPVQHSRLPPRPDPATSSDSDVPVDMDTYGGGFPGRLNYQYGHQPSQSYLDAHDGLQRQSSSATSLRRSDISGDTRAMPAADYSLAGEDAIHPFPAFGARTDAGGTGGLSEPSANPRRLSFEDGDEATLVGHDDYNDSSSTPSTGRNSVRSTTSYHTRSLSRPLPQIPGASGSDYYRARRQTDQLGRPIYPQAPEEYEQNYASGSSAAAVQKANSTGSHSHAPLVVPPGRSITDAEQRRRQLTTLRTSISYEHSLNPDGSSGTSSKLVEDIVLPTIPAGRRRKFVPSKLSTAEFKRCSEPWAQSSLLAWIKEMTEGETDLREQAIVDGLVALFTHKVPTMNTADAEALSAQLVEQMFQQGALLKDEEWVKFGVVSMTGVIFQLTGTGCYSPRVHTSTISGRCYAHHCMRTLKKINLQTHALAPQRKAEDWVTFYKIKKEDVANVPKKDIERQNNLHEIVTSEDYYMDQLNVLRILYRDGLAHSPQHILSPKCLDGFLRDVFGKVDPIKQANEDYLLAQLKYRQEEQGPWIKGFSDIFREWIRKAKTAYVEYAASFPNATLLVRKEAEKNVLFRQFLDQMRENERSRRLGWDTYLKAPITRLQRYGLLLQTVHKNMVTESEEKNNLSIAIEEIKAVTLECDAKVAEMSKRTDLADLQNKLKLRPGMEKVQLNLNHLGREIVFRGDLQRRGNNKVNWLDVHAILFDHYMVLTKPIQQRDAAGGLKHEVYDVSKLPIPMDLLVLESTNDDAVVKSSVKGITAVPGSTARNQSSQDGRSGKVTSNSLSGTAGPGTLTHSNTGTSIMSNGSGKTLVTSTTLDGSNDKVLYPFRIKHLGKQETYILYSLSAQNRQDWCDKIIEAKTRHAASLFAQNAEPFRIRVMADTAFGYDSQSGGPRGIVIKGTPLDRAVEECEKSFYGTGPRPGPVCRAQVNCATSFNQPNGKRMVAVGTDFGVFVSDYDNARGWTRAVQASYVTQIAVLEDFSIVLIISNKSLIAYHLDSVCPAAGANASDSSRKAPQKLSGNRDVGFFTTGRMKDRTLVFYKKREGLSSTFKVLEPVYQKSATSTRSRFGLKKGTTEFFRDFDDFYIPSESYAINLFQSSLAVATTRGVEVLALDKKLPLSIPDLRGPEVASIATRIADQKPLGMFRLSDNEFLLVYEEVGIYVDKHGDVSRAVVMEFVGRAKQACLHGSTYLVLVDVGSGFVEVRNAVNGRLRQVVSGRDVKLLDDGGVGGSVKICMQHPENERQQVVVELIVNEGLKE